MTKEEKQILIKDLCARLPYGVKVTDGLHTITLKVRIDTAPATLAQFMQSENLRYYLRPMSSMTEEERKQLACKIGAEEIELQTEFKYFSAKYFYCGEYDNNGNECLYFSVEMYIKAIEWFLENHFDYRGLIEKGLALEAPEGMYKIE